MDLSPLKYTENTKNISKNSQELQGLIQDFS